MLFFFFQAEDGIRDKLVTGVQTCALPICARVDPHAHRDEGDGHDDPAVEEGQCQRIRFAGGSPRAARRIFSAKVPAKATRSMAAFSAWSGGESITSEVIDRKSTRLNSSH